MSVKYELLHNGLTYLGILCPCNHNHFPDFNVWKVSGSKKYLAKLKKARRRRGFEPAALCTGCLTKSGLMAELIFEKPKFTASQTNECSIQPVSFAAFDNLKREKKHQ